MAVEKPAQCGCLPQQFWQCKFGNEYYFLALPITPPGEYRNGGHNECVARGPQEPDDEWGAVKGAGIFATDGAAIAANPAKACGAARGQRGGPDSSQAAVGEHTPPAQGLLLPEFSRLDGGELSAGIESPIRHM